MEKRQQCICCLCKSVTCNDAIMKEKSISVYLIQDFLCFNEWKKLNSPIIRRRPQNGANLWRRSNYWKARVLCVSATDISCVMHYFGFIDPPIFLIAKFSFVYVVQILDLTWLDSKWQNIFDILPKCRNSNL